VPADGGAAEINRDGVDVFIRNIDSMVALARARGVEVLLTTFPMRGGPGGTRRGQTSRRRSRR
jgi:nicotinamidase-related amidase